LIEIRFQKEEDAKKLYQLLQRHHMSSQQNDTFTLHLEDPYIIKCALKDEVQVFGWVKESLCHFIMNKKLNEWIKDILTNQYYYDDEEEQLNIIEIVHSVLEGKMDELTVFLPPMKMKEHVETLVTELLQHNKSITFDSFVTFRLRSFMDQLEQYVQLALDEYKMEQEYQIFIHTLREFLSKREPKLQKIHIILQETTIFFDDEFNEIKRSHLMSMVDRKLLINHPVYVDSVTIAPLLSIAPQQIYLYTDDKDQPLVRTIRNIFEERLMIQSVESFSDNNGMKECTSKEKFNCP
jgi:putative sporulation protein YtxC